MFDECTKTGKDECLLSLLKLVKIDVFDYTKTRKNESLLSELKLERMNVS